MLDNVKYIFQIPMAWFRRVNRLLFMWGGDGINVDMNAEDGPKISLNPKRVSDMIAEAGGSGGSGPELSNTTPVAPNQSGAAAGSATTAARGDHKHPLSSNTLTSSKWVRMDSNGNLETPTVQPVAVNQTTYPPQTTTVTVVTGVEWTGSVLRYKKLTLTFTSGLLTGKGSESNTTIDTPVTYNQ